MGPTAYYASKFFFYFQQKQIYRYPKLEDDNPRQFNHVVSVDL